MAGAGVAHITSWRSRNRNTPAANYHGNEALTNTYPTSSRLGCKVWIAPGADLTQPPSSWPWADITNYVRHQSGISVTTGRRDERSLVESGEGSLTLDNRDGRFSRRNPASPYYPYLTKNTPILATVDPGSGQVARMQMFVNNWPNRSDRSGNDVTTPISCAGVLRRLAQGSVLKSPLRRAISASSPTAFWPLEDGGDSSLFVSAIDPSMNGIVPTDTAPDAAVGPDGSDGAVEISSLLVSLLADTGTMTLPVTSYTSTGTTLTTVHMRHPTDNLPAGTVITGGAWSVASTGGSIARLACLWQSSGAIGITVGAIDANGTLLFTFGDANTRVTGADWHEVQILAVQSGSTITLSLRVDGTVVATTSQTHTLGTVTTFKNFGGQNADGGGNLLSGSNAIGVFEVAHIGLHTSDVGDFVDAMGGYVGEQAHTRIMRLCSEEGIPIVCTGAPSTRMGVQSTDTFINLVRDAESTDLGLLYETGFGLGYQLRTDRHNAAVTLSLDFNQGHIADPPAPEDDDFQLTNSFAVTRTNGGASQTSTNDTNISSNGLYDDSADVSLEDDEQAANAASWRVHLGTNDEERWPSLTMDFASSGGRSLIPYWLALGFGARVQVANPPDTYSPYPIDVFMEGWTERWDPISWDVEFNTSPAWPYEVYVVGSSSGNRGRVDSASSTLSTAISSTATSLTVATTGTTWIDSATYPTYFPFYIDLRGEQVTVTAISGTTSPQTFTVTRSVNNVVLSHPASTTVSLWKPSVYAM